MPAASCRPSRRGSSPSSATASSATWCDGGRASRDMQMKVLVADKFEQSGLNGLRAIGCDVDYVPDAKDDALAEAVRRSGAAVLVVRSTPVPAAVLDAGPLSLIVRAGAGVNTIDVAGASQRGIYVSNCPGKNAVAVAEL